MDSLGGAMMLRLPTLGVRQGRRSVDDPAYLPDYESGWPEGNGNLRVSGSDGQIPMPLAAIPMATAMCPHI
jgi:hypothetical protein